MALSLFSFGSLAFFAFGAFVVWDFAVFFVNMVVLPAKDGHSGHCHDGESPVHVQTVTSDREGHLARRAGIKKE